LPKKNLREDELKELIDFIAANPTAGDLIQGTGGMRKLRYAIKGKGKSGGARIITYYFGRHAPIFLIGGFAKNEMENISKAAKNTLKKLAEEIADQYK